jgi:nitrate reductase gamma subunit
MNIQINDIGHVIQLAIAPVFLLTGVATLLMVLTNRLARIIDRSRTLEDRLDTKHSGRDMDELEVLYRRSNLINVAITLGTITGFLVCLVIAMLFTSDTTNVALDKAIAACFVLGMLTLIGAFIYLLREIFIASKSMVAHRRQRPRI